MQNTGTTKLESAIRGALSHKWQTITGICKVMRHPSESNVRYRLDLMLAQGEIERQQMPSKNRKAFFYRRKQ